MHTTKQQDNQTTTQLNNKTTKQQDNTEHSESNPGRSLGGNDGTEELSGRQYLVLRVSLFFRYCLSDKSHCVAVWSSSC